MLDSHLALLQQDKAAVSEPAPAQQQQLNTAQQELRTCLALRVLLLETRQQLHLLCSNFAAARADAAASAQLLNQFPALLQDLRTSVHLQAGLYAQAVGAYAAAAGHFAAVAQQAEQAGLQHLAADGRSLAAICNVALHNDESGGSLVVGGCCCFFWVGREGRVWQRADCFVLNSERRGVPSARLFKAAFCPTADGNICLLILRRCRSAARGNAPAIVAPPPPTTTHTHKNSQRCT